MIEIIAKLIAAPITKSINNGQSEQSDIKAMIENLSPVERQEYDRQFNERRKKILHGYLFWMSGLHYGYTKQWFRLVFFLGTVGGFFVWWSLDGLLMFHIIGKYNRKIAKEILFSLPLPSESSVNSSMSESVQNGMIGAAQSRFSQQRKSNSSATTAQP